MWLAVPERVMMKSPVRENRPPGSVRGAPGNRRPYRDPADRLCLSALLSRLKRFAYSFDGGKRMECAPEVFQKLGLDTRRSRSVGCETI
jgi:hypothetical protein